MAVAVFVCFGTSKDSLGRAARSAPLRARGAFGEARTAVLRLKFQGRPGRSFEAAKVHPTPVADADQRGGPLPWVLAEGLLNED